MKVKMIKLKNYLRMKLGRDEKDAPGYIEDSAIREADELIEKLCAECPQAIGKHLDEMVTHWKNMRDMEQSPEREKLASEIFTLAHEIKDIAAMCGYDLVAYFAESLRDFVGQTKLQLDAQRVIIQAHVDAIQVTHNKDLRDDAGPVAEELKKAVKQAIKKYS